MTLAARRALPAHRRPTLTAAGGGQHRPGTTHRRRDMHRERRGTRPVGFDLDMTLIDSRRAILASWAALAAETVVPVDLADVDRRLGAKLEDEIAQWFPAGQRDAAAASYRRHYLTVAAGLTTALPAPRRRWPPSARPARQR
jgi:hypothetical protein